MPPFSKRLTRKTSKIFKRLVGSRQSSSSKLLNKDENATSTMTIATAQASESSQRSVMDAPTKATPTPTTPQTAVDDDNTSIVTSSSTRSLKSNSQGHNEPLGEANVAELSTTTTTRPFLVEKRQVQDKADATRACLPEQKIEARPFCNFTARETPMPATSAYPNQVHYVSDDEDDYDGDSDYDGDYDIDDDSSCGSDSSSDDDEPRSAKLNCKAAADEDDDDVDALLLSRVPGLGALFDKIDAQHQRVSVQLCDHQATLDRRGDF